MRLAIFTFCILSVCTLPAYAEQGGLPKGTYKMYDAQTCAYGVRLRPGSLAEDRAQKIAAKEISQKIRLDVPPKSVVCDLGLMLVVDYRGVNTRNSVISYVTIDQRSMKAYQVFMNQ